MTRFARAVDTLAPLALLSLVACGGDLTLPGGSAAGLALRVVDGNLQVGQVGQPLPKPVVVLVQTETGTPIDGRRVAFTMPAGSAESFDPDTAVTNSKGEATTRWKLGTVPGAYTGEAIVVAVDDTTVLSASFQADAIPGDPDTLRADGPTSQPGSRGNALAEPLTVKVVDRFGNPVSGAEVEWKVSRDGDGQLSQEKVPTDANGISSVTWTLGNNILVQRAEARVGNISGSPVAFVAAVLF
ncbi:MAG TPA: Ig-like domain-containing protein [Gemmatimonadales bacterium]|nr:Ig-like domain-containing protein [Gemmatimonadales bacterium]